MHSDFSIERDWPTLFGLFCGFFLSITLGTMAGEWAGTDMGLLNLSEFKCLVARTGFAVGIAGSMLYLALFLLTEWLFPPKVIVWHGIEFFTTIVIGLVVIAYGLDGMMPWYRQDALTSVPLSLFIGLLCCWVFRFCVVLWLFRRPINLL